MINHIGKQIILCHTLRMYKYSSIATILYICTSTKNYVSVVGAGYPEVHAANPASSSDNTVIGVGCIVLTLEFFHIATNGPRGISALSFQIAVFIGIVREAYTPRYITDAQNLELKLNTDPNCYTRAAGLFSIKILSYQKNNAYFKNNTFVRPSFFIMGIPIPGKRVSILKHHL